MGEAVSAYLGGTEGAGADALYARMSDRSGMDGDAMDLYDYSSCIHDGAGGFESLNTSEKHVPTWERINWWRVLKPVTCSGKWVRACEGSRANLLTAIAARMGITVQRETPAVTAKAWKLEWCRWGTYMIPKDLGTVQ